MPTSFSCQRSSFRSTNSDRNVSAPGGALSRSGVGAAKKTRTKLKNPATSAGRIRPSLWAHSSRAFGRMCSKLVFFLPGVDNQPHLWKSRQARSVIRLPRESGLHQLQDSITKSKLPSSCIQDFSTHPSQSACEFHRRCGNPVRSIARCSLIIESISMSLSRWRDRYLGPLDLGQRKCTSPFLVIDATNGNLVLRQSFCIFARAASNAPAISLSDRLPEANTNSRTECCSKARFSRRLYRIRLSAVSRTHPFFPICGNQSSSGTPRGKRSRWRKNRTFNHARVSLIAAELQRFSSK